MSVKYLQFRNVFVFISDSFQGVCLDIFSSLLQFLLLGASSLPSVCMVQNKRDTFIKVSALLNNNQAKQINGSRNRNIFPPAEKVAEMHLRCGI